MTICTYHCIYNINKSTLYIYDKISVYKYFSYYYEDYDGEQIISTISTNLSKDEINIILENLIVVVKDNVKS